MQLFWSQGQIPFYQKYFIQSCGHKTRGASILGGNDARCVNEILGGETKLL